MMGYMGFTRFTIGLDSQQAVAILKDGMDWWCKIGNVVEDVHWLMVDREVAGVFYQHRKGNGGGAWLRPTWTNSEITTFLERPCSPMAKHFVR
ncbi:unnamed protein product [Prunus brigantina]